eukprot:g6095.t1
MRGSRGLLATNSLRIRRLYRAANGLWQDFGCCAGHGCTLGEYRSRRGPVCMSNRRAGSPTATPRPSLKDLAETLAVSVELPRVFRGDIPEPLPVEWQEVEPEQDSQEGARLRQTLE